MSIDDEIAPVFSETAGRADCTDDALPVLGTAARSRHLDRESSAFLQKAADDLIAAAGDFFFLARFVIGAEL